MFYVEIQIASLIVLVLNDREVPGFPPSRLCRNSKKCHKSQYPEITENTEFRIALRLYGTRDLNGYDEIVIAT